MRLDLSADEVLATTRSVRKRLDFDRPVEHDIIMECLELALQAPTGSNRQGWQWVFVTDEAKKLALQEIYLKNFTWYSSQPRPKYDGDDPRAAAADKVADSATYLAENMHRAPVLLVPCLEGRPVDGVGGMGASFWGSLLPAVWSFMLALRERGIGSSWTTLHLIGGGEEQAAELLGIPFERYSQAGLFPIAYTMGTDFKVASRLPATEVSHWDTW
ncbi:MAG TPA: nitroreductase family protein [Ilumatobacter sp.]|nr:nitroreductase family protein [Ilumatobacter sp.]